MVVTVWLARAPCWRRSVDTSYKRNDINAFDSKKQYPGVTSEQRLAGEAAATVTVVSARSARHEEVVRAAVERAHPGAGPGNRLEVGGLGELELGGGLQSHSALPGLGLDTDPVAGI